MTTYTQTDFEKIINHGICWQIPSETLHIIKDLESRCQARALKQARNFDTHHRRFTAAPRRGVSSMPPPPIAATPAWKPTAGAAVKQEDLGGCSSAPSRKKIRQNIKIALNKLSKANFEKLKTEVLAEFAMATAVSAGEESETGSSEEFVKTLMQEVFAIMGKTRDATMSTLYAELWTELAKAGVQAEEVVEAELLKYRNDVFAVKTLNPETENDAFCEYQKIVSERRGRAVFLTNLICRGVICREAGVAILQHLVETVEAHVANLTQNRKVHVEEGIEHILLIVHTGLNMWVSDLVWPEIYGRLLELSRVVIAEKPNMTNRVKFKLQDLLAGAGAAPSAATS